MKYETLKALFYQYPDNFEKIYKERLNNPLAIKTGLQVYPYDKKHQARIKQSYEMFYLPNAELSILIEKVHLLIQKYSLTENANNILFILAQQNIFGTQYNQLSDEELSQILDLSRYKIGQAMDELTKQNLVKQIGKLPIIHIINDKIIKNLQK